MLGPCLAGKQVLLRCLGHIGYTAGAALMRDPHAHGAHTRAYLPLYPGGEQAPHGRVVRGRTEPAPRYCLARGRFTAGVPLTSVSCLAYSGHRASAGRRPGIHEAFPECLTEDRKVRFRRGHARAPPGRP